MTQVLWRDTRGVYGVEIVGGRTRLVYNHPRFGRLAGAMFDTPSDAYLWAVRRRAELAAWAARLPR